MRLTDGQVVRAILSAILFALCSSAEAQQRAKTYRIGVLSRRGAPTAELSDPNADAFRQGLRDHGYIEGKNIQLEYRYADGKGDRFPQLIADLIQLKVDVLVSGTIQAIRAAKQATKTTPIVMVITADPVATGLIDSLAHPGGNITGVTRLIRDLSGKRLELLKETIPRVLRVGVLGDTSAQTTVTAFRDYATAARALNIEAQFIEVRDSNIDFESAFQSALKGRLNGIVAVSGALFLDNAKTIADLAIKHRVASMYENNDHVKAGGLMSYTSNDAENYRRAAYYVDRILKGAKSGDLPVEQPTKFELVINLKTAKQIGLTIPPNVLARADRVIR
jgi:putative ABC transport system substrate-binding protein